MWFSNVVSVLFLSAILASWQSLLSFHWRKTQIFLLEFLASSLMVGGWWPASTWGKYSSSAGHGFQHSAACQLPNSPLYLPTHVMGLLDTRRWVLAKLDGSCIADNKYSATIRTPCEARTTVWSYDISVAIILDGS